MLNKPKQREQGLNCLRGAFDRAKKYDCETNAAMRSKIMEHCGDGESAKYLEIFDAMHKDDSYGRRTFDLDGTRKLLVAIEAGTTPHTYTDVEKLALRFHVWFGC